MSQTLPKGKVLKRDSDVAADLVCLSSVGKMFHKMGALIEKAPLKHGFSKKNSESEKN